MSFEELPHFRNRSRLSPKQLEVVAYLVHGFSSKETARQLHVSPRTIECHRLEVMRRLGARNCVEVTRIVYSLQ